MGRFERRWAGGKKLILGIGLWVWVQSELGRQTGRATVYFFVFECLNPVRFSWLLRTLGPIKRNEPLCLCVSFLFGEGNCVAHALPKKKKEREKMIWDMQKKACQDLVKGGRVCAQQEVAAASKSLSYVSFCHTINVILFLIKHTYTHLILAQRPTTHIHTNARTRILKRGSVQYAQCFHYPNLLVDLGGRSNI